MALPGIWWQHLVARGNTWVLSTTVTRKGQVTIPKAVRDRLGVLPDFYIGAQALAGNLPLLTRCKGRYQTYFPGVRLISPSER